VDGDILEVNEDDDHYIFKIVGSKFIRDPIGHHTDSRGEEVTDSKNLDEITNGHPEDSITGVGGTRVF